LSPINSDLVAAAMIDGLTEGSTLDSTQLIWNLHFIEEQNCLHKSAEFPFTTRANEDGELKSRKSSISISSLLLMLKKLQFPHRATIFHIRNESNSDW
jgi:hypothetical protein